MEKLIELLNEYNCNVLKRADEWKLKNSIDHPWTKYISLSSVWAWKIYLYVISKEFWFIKRLVDNDKIDFEKNKLQVLKDIDVRGEVMYDYTLFDKADGVIMHLAISDNPIEDLISYLR